MSNFSRAIRLALRHRLTVIASVLCSLAVAILWAANIATVLPIVDGVMQGKSIPVLLEETIAANKNQVAEINDEIAALNKQLAHAAPATQRILQGELSASEYRRDKALGKIAFWRWFQPAVHHWLPRGAFETLAVVCLALFVGTFLKSLFRIAGTFFMARLGQLTDFQLRKEFYRRTLQLDLATFGQTSPGDLMNRFTGEIEAIAAGTQAVFGMAIREPLKMFTCLALAAWVSWQLLLLTIISAPLAGYAIHWLSKALKRANRRAQEEFSSVYELLEETFSGLKVIKAFTMESRERSRFHQVSKQYYHRSMKIAMYNSLVSPTTEMMGIGMIIAAMLAGGYLVLNGETHLLGIRISDTTLSHGMMGLFFGSLAGASDPIRRLSSVFNSLQRAVAASDRVYGLLDRESQVVDPPVPAKLPLRLGRIQFRNVAFSYNPAETVLKNVNLQVKRGEKLAIIGPNGSGKSTMMNLLARFYDPTEGAVTIDGINLRDVRLRDLRRRIGVVTQETTLFDDTVANNIRYGCPGATQAEIETAARQAHAHQFIIEQLAESYDTFCGTRGNRLSGGQRQRIALARAILRDPEILILDEATSQIDAESEHLIHEVLEKFVQGRTAFMITHRPSTLALADRIVVMERGQILDVGSSNELSARCELFRRLAHLEYRESA
ncbi:MAG: ABC transporter ATP-binding protein/permease [Pirellulales bacterium]|nr:ABC transporter ATP-binding protein/permease [Pirellulales bacterium]